MTAFVAWCVRASRFQAFRSQAWVVLALLIAASTPGSAFADAITVSMDQARILKLPERTATLVVGNPLIADISVQPGGLMVVTGKGYGVTNVIALDRAGAVVMDHSIAVQGPRDNVVVVYRGIERESYSCMPKCERRITLGDSVTSFNATLAQTTNLNLQAQGMNQPQTQQK